MGKGDQKLKVWRFWRVWEEKKEKYSEVLSQRIPRGLDWVQICERYLSTGEGCWPPTVLYTLDLTFTPCLYLLITLMLLFSRLVLPWESSIYIELGSCTHLSLYFCALSQNTVLKLLITQLHKHNMNLRIMIKIMEL